MNDFLAYITLRSVILFASSAFSILLIMLVLNIITVDDVIAILHLSPEGASAFKTVVFRIQEVTGNILDIISALLNKLFSWAGVDIDLNKIHVDVNQHHSTNPQDIMQNNQAAPAAGQSSSE